MEPSFPCNFRHPSCSVWIGKSTPSYPLDLAIQREQMKDAQFQGRNLLYQGREVRVVAIRDLTLQKQMEQENRILHVSLAECDRFGLITGRSAVMKQVYHRIFQAASSSDVVTIYGETGTGKELAARTIFQLSDHHQKKFVPVNCAAINDELFESQFFGYRSSFYSVFGNRRRPRC